MKERYSTYKSSGVEWIGEIPKHWELKRLGFGVDTIVPMRDKPEDLTGEIPWIRIEDNVGKYISTSKSSQGVSLETIKKMNLKVYPIGCVLTTCSCSFGTSMIVKEPIVSNQTFIGLVTKNDLLFNEYLYYILQVWKEELELQSSGSIQLYLSRDNFKSLRVLYPPLSEQEQIVKYLDEKTSQIDGLISITEKKIELLKQKRTSLINEVVTKGLNPDVELKDTGVEWIGEIPKHWDKTKLKYNGRFVSGFSFNSDDFQQEGFVRVLKISNIQNDGISWEDLSFLPDNYYEKYNEFQLRKMDLVFVLTRPIISTGIKICFYNEDYQCLLNQRNCIYRTNEVNLSKLFLYYLVRCDYFIEGFKLQLKETNQPNISSEQISNIHIFLPPLIEQEQIIEYIDTQTTEIDNLVFIEQRRINTLKEYRQSLISEVVTGKVRVCEEVTQLQES